MKALVRGKRVAVIGRAGSILERGKGKVIDRADVVIRVNWLLPIPEYQIVDVGARTDLLYTCQGCETARALGREHGVPSVTVRGRQRRKATEKYFRRSDGIRATTGFLCVTDCLRYGAKEVRLYGFDLFESAYFQERTPDGNNASGHADGSWVHSVGYERKAWRKLIGREPRVVPDPVFRRALQGRERRPVVAPMLEIQP